MVAIDGIINMIGARSFNESLTPEMRDTFGWTRRVILERIAAHDGKFHLYQLLADIGQEVEDTQAAFVALENSLSEAGIRRGAVLRELVTLATPNAGFAGFTTGTGDAQRQITHGRRLIGLKQALPPEVYINLGKALLETDAVQDAERAFDLIDDITGMIDIDRTKADVFHEAGYPDRALGAYTRALNVNRDDLSLLSRTATLREANGQDAVAHRLYFRALDNLLRSQPSTRPTERPGESQQPAARAFGLDTDTSVTRDYRRYFEALVQGFLITWPDSAADAREITQTVKTMFDTELGTIAESLAAGAKPSGNGTGQARPLRVSAESLAPGEKRSGSDSDPRDLRDYPRLERTSWFANRVADRADAPALREHVDSELRRFFSTDDTHAEPDEPLLHRQRDVAMGEGDFETAVRLARVAGDEDGLLSLLRDRIDAGKYRDGLGYARSLLEPMALRRLVAAIAPTLKDNKRAFAEVISTAPEPVLGIEAALGRELISPTELIDLLEDPEVVDNTDNPFVANEGLWRFIQAKLSLDQQVRYFAAIAARQEKSQFLASLPRVILHDLLAVDLTSTQGDQLLAAGSELFNKLDLQMEFALAEALALFLNSHVIPANRELVYGLAEVVQQTTQLPLDLAAALRRILDGTDDESFAGLVEWEQAGLHNFGDISGAGKRYEAIRERILVGTDELDDAIDDDRRDADFVRTVYEWEFAPRFDLPSPDLAARQVAVLPGLIDRYPKDQRYGMELANAYPALGEQANIREALFGCYRRDPADKFLRAALYFHLRYQDQFALAQEVATDGGPNLREAAVLDELLEELRGKNRFQDSPGSRLFRQVYRGGIPAPPGSWSSDVEQSLDFLRLSVKVEDEAT